MIERHWHTGGRLEQIKSCSPIVRSIGMPSRLWAAGRYPPRLWSCIVPLSIWTLHVQTTTHIGTRLSSHISNELYLISLSSFFFHFWIISQHGIHCSHQTHRHQRRPGGILDIRRLQPVHWIHWTTERCHQELQDWFRCASVKGELEADISTAAHGIPTDDLQ